jgi:guanylate kinase
VKQGKLFVISSPSGGGKSTIINELRKRDPSLCYSISATTRPPRNNEKNGVDYYFFDKKTFFKTIEQREFLEWAVVHGFYYGTLKRAINDFLKKGKTILLDIDVQGGLQIKQQSMKPILIFLKPPSWEILSERLKNRGTEDTDTLQNRLKAAKVEMEKSNEYDFIVINDILDDTVKEIEAIIHKCISSVTEECIL